MTSTSRMPAWASRAIERIGQLRDQRFALAALLRDLLGERFILF